MSLIDCIRKVYFKLIKLLIEKGADLNDQDKNGYTPLMWACKYNHTEIIELLLDKGAIL